MGILDWQPVGNSELVRVEGSDYEQGFALGRLTGNLMWENVVRRKRMLRELPASDLAHFEELAQRNQAFMRQVEPDVFDELQGMSEGSGIRLEDLMLLNFHWFVRARNIAMECSCFFARGSATSDGKTYLAKTRDQQRPETHVVVERHYPDGETILEVIAAGAPVFPPAGLNSSGVALVSSGVWSKYSQADLSRADSAYVMADVRMLLRNATTLREVAEVLRQSKYVAGINLTGVDLSGGCTIEVTRDDVVVTDTGDTGVLTNHYVSESLLDMSIPRPEYPSTYHRYERLQELLGQNHGRVSFKEMLSYLQDHKDGPQNSICRHPQGVKQAETYDPAFGFAQGSSSISQVALIIVPEDGELWATLQNPCIAVKRVTLTP